MTIDDLLPCPKCGSRKLRIVKLNRFDEILDCRLFKVSIRCDQCGATLDRISDRCGQDAEMMAQADWNRRATNPDGGMGK